jgi:hypothetical protein
VSGDNAPLEVSGGEVVHGNCCGGINIGAGGVNRTGEGGHTIAAERGGVEATVRRESMTGAGSCDRQCEIEGAAVKGVRIERNSAVKCRKHRQAKNGVDCDVGSERKRKGNRVASGIGVWCEITDNRREVSVVGCVEIVGVSDSAAKLDGFEWVSLVE